jgi:hypothetical protein
VIIFSEETLKLYHKVSKSLLGYHRPLIQIQATSKRLNNQFLGLFKVKFMLLKENLVRFHI